MYEYVYITFFVIFLKVLLLILCHSVNQSKRLGCVSHTCTVSCSLFAAVDL